MKKLALLLLVLLLLPVASLAADTVTITSVEDFGNCAVTVNFDNPLGGKTTLLALHEDYAVNKGGFSFGEASQYESSYTFYDLAPGETYMLYALNEDDSDSAGFYLHTVTEPMKYSSNDVRLYDVNLCYFRPDSVQGDYGYNYATKLSAGKIESMLHEEMFLIKADFRHNVFSSDFDQRILTVVRTPSGMVLTNATDTTISKDCVGFWLTVMYMNDAFNEMIESTGSIPSGRYDVEVYLEGKLLGTDSFTIKSN